MAPRKKPAEEQGHGTLPRVPCPCVIGIDPGLRGGVVVLAADLSCVLAKHRMPVREDFRGRRTIDFHALCVLLHPWAERCVVGAMEEQHSFGHESRSRLWRFALGVGRTQAALEACMIPYTEVDPQTWKRSVLGSRSASKADAVAYVRSKWPEAEFSSSDGIAEAACIAVHAAADSMDEGGA